MTARTPRRRRPRMLIAAICDIPGCCVPDYLERGEMHQSTTDDGIPVYHAFLKRDAQEPRWYVLKGNTGIVHA